MVQVANQQRLNQTTGLPQYQGALFINQKKTKENQPDYKGQIEIQGRKFWISSWSNTSVGGRPYQRLVLEDFTDEDYRKSNEIEEQRRIAAEQAANQNQSSNAAWGRPQQGTGQMQSIAQMAAPVKPAATAPIDPTNGYSPKHNVQHGSYSAPTPPDNFDDD